jgi:membrane protein implicated in regulation of membrane protease activity
MPGPPSASVERSPESWSDAPVGNAVALAVLAITAVYFLLVPQAALLVGALIVGTVAVVTLPVVVAAGLTLSLLYLHERRRDAASGPDDRYATRPGPREP